MPDDDHGDDGDRQDGDLPEAENREGHLLSVLDDQYDVDEPVRYSDRVVLTRCETDRPLYTVFYNGKIATTIDPTMIGATHLLRGFLEELHQHDPGQGSMGDPTGWH